MVIGMVSDQAFDDGTSKTHDLRRFQKLGKGADDRIFALVKYREVKSKKAGLVRRQLWIIEANAWTYPSRPASL